MSLVWQSPSLEERGLNDEGESHTSVRTGSEWHVFWECGLLYEGDSHTSLRTGSEWHVFWSVACCTRDSHTRKENWFGMTCLLICGPLYGRNPAFSRIASSLYTKALWFRYEFDDFFCNLKKFFMFFAAEKNFVIARNRAFLINRRPVPSGKPSAFGQTTRYSIYSIG